MSESGICGRGVLIDHVSYALKRGKYRDAYTHHSIPLSELLEAANEQGVSFHEGDILFIRSGFTRTYDQLTRDEQVQKSLAPPSFTGVESTVEVAKWIWDNKFSAVAGDFFSSPERTNRLARDPISWMGLSHWRVVRLGETSDSLREEQ